MWVGSTIYKQIVWIRYFNTLLSLLFDLNQQTTQKQEKNLKTFLLSTLHIPIRRRLTAKYSVRPFDRLFLMQMVRVCICVCLCVLRERVRAREKESERRKSTSTKSTRKSERVTGRQSDIEGEKERKSESDRARVIERQRRREEKRGQEGMSHAFISSYIQRLYPTDEWDMSHRSLRDLET